MPNRLSTGLHVHKSADRTTDGRDAIFALLDYYIDIGYGAVPRVVIERLEAENGGRLPDEVPHEYREQECTAEQKAKISRGARERRLAEKRAKIQAAVENPQKRTYRKRRIFA